ncbi:MAG: DsbA family protein [Chloroflexi bacterium AL-W]|nr:DsbA family protein [Chloroflexi bacterium AL-N1]NOK70592.1 DsbA family protein [Chloroflexi bacterium AL-N10]NOK77584.1 DsbA family protein [Chloroflexi bacterium AL-N5]NOK84435.1 DsbA family protein [Chloroflexi bacterium AL-W]NOK92324.1 DsbA family protein [Chloroflexi bacterium AL-N15]
MSTRAQRRGRTVEAKKNSMMPFYIIIGVVAVVGVVVVGLLLRATGGQTAEPVAMTSLDQFESKGDPDAPVTVVKYSDFGCGGCAAYALGLGPQIEQQYIETGQVHFVYHEYPVTGPNGVLAAEAGRCAADQESFWPMHDLLFQNQQQWSRLPEPDGQFTLYAQQLGLNTDQFQQCLEEDQHLPEILGAEQAARSAEIPATPTFVINGQQYNSDGLVAAIDAALAAADTEGESDTADGSGETEAPSE